MSHQLVPCAPPSKEELETLVPQRPIKIEGNYVHRYLDPSGATRYERVTHEWAEPRWYRVE